MQEIKDILNKERKTSQAGSERASLIEMFLETLNMELNVENELRYRSQRFSQPNLTVEEFKKLKLPQNKRYHQPFTPARIGFMMSHLSVGDLWSFYKECSNAKCGFSRAWRYGLKVKK